MLKSRIQLTKLLMLTGIHLQWRKIYKNSYRLVQTLINVRTYLQKKQYGVDESQVWTQKWDFFLLGWNWDILKNPTLLPNTIRKFSILTFPLSTYLHWFFPILQFEISSLMNLIFIPVWNQLEIFPVQTWFFFQVSGIW